MFQINQFSWNGLLEGAFGLQWHMCNFGSSEFESNLVIVTLKTFQADATCSLHESWTLVIPYACKIVHCYNPHKFKASSSTQILINFTRDAPRTRFLEITFLINFP